jgi:hypothetical protein
VSRLEELGIRKMVEGPVVSLYTRGNCVAAVGGTQGSTGFMTEQGLLYLVWREGVPMLTGRGAEVVAEPGQVEEITRFTQDLKAALNP